MIGHIFARLLWVLAVFSAGILGLIAVAIAINVALRNLGLPVIYGALDAIQYALMIATFMGAPWVLAQGGHVKVDLITSALPPRTEQTVGRVTNLVGAVTAGILGWYGLQAAIASAARGSMIRTSFVIPEWWMLAFVPASMALCVIVFLRKVLQPDMPNAPLSGL
ncbi:TRAP transporter small permease [Roseobacter sp. GAI101]|uniref:TRAP transporter small permease n=1 Tax=Roseobacter sp. (strain GAI101) TaxID=391589 RepID=UPI0001872213|nr:TRAP transporter small permease [Roseobacter sp. GAI101]EEB84663.1 TRAP transporter, DctQ-like membrane protein [Roseobacter sp. GAI101]